MPDVDCKDLDKKNEDAKWAAREASEKEFDAMDKVTYAADQIKDAHDYFDEANMTDPEIVEAQIDLIEQARQETADQIREARDDWSDAHAAGASNGETSDKIDALNKEMDELDNTERWLSDLLADYEQARDEHTAKSEEADEALDNWDEHCGDKDAADAGADGGGNGE
jgi:chromosome segregation ATPase